jgi:hypothetical protein
VRTLWREFDFGRYVTESREGLSYSKLFEAAGTDDSGNFNYHLRQLDGVLVESREDGYVLTPLGYNLMQSIDRYDAFEYATLDERVIEDPCPYCGGDLAAEYSREVLSVRCRDCGGLASEGSFTFVEVSATGERRPGMSDLLDAATLAMFRKIRASSQGICWDCRSAMERSIERCEAHVRGPGGVCDECDLRYEAAVDAECPDCGANGRGPILEYAIVSPTVGAFFAGFDSGPAQVGPWKYRLAALGAATERVVDTDPVVVEYGFDGPNGGLEVRVENAPGSVVVERRD